MASLSFRSLLRRGAAAVLAIALLQSTGIIAAGQAEATEYAGLTTFLFSAQQSLDDKLRESNPLYGKSLVALGDSLTAGHGIEPDPATGIIPTYPVIVGNRNNMQVLNLAINGAWMTSGRYSGYDIEGFSTYFDDEGFLPDQIDYLTINLGANDWTYGVLGMMDDYCLSHFGTIYYKSTAKQRAEAETAEDWIAKFVGSDSDTDITTWLGAWNTVLTYLRKNYPLTKIGILVAYPSYDVDTEFAHALRTSLFAIADKYGYPTLDCGNPDQWFCIGYASGLDPAVADLITPVYTLDRCHPNALGHQMMSNSYEAWLRRL
jgi:lysophospholipase L1-like esterase